MVDIIIPAYNAHKTIEKTLFSVLYQDYLEKINTYIVNDNSDKDYSEFVTFFSNFMNIKELVLNDEDTKNILDAVQLVRDLQGQAAAYQASLTNSSIISPRNINNNSLTELKQEVTITATFPNVNSKTEIEEAFIGLSSQASQRVLDRNR